MFAGLASPTHLIIVLVLVLLLFEAKRIPDLAKGVGTGIKELREGSSTDDSTEAKASETEDAHSGGPAPELGTRRSARTPPRGISKPRVRHRHAGDGDHRTHRLGHLRSQKTP